MGGGLSRSKQSKSVDSKQKERLEEIANAYLQDTASSNTLNNYADAYYMEPAQDNSPLSFVEEHEGGGHSYNQQFYAGDMSPAGSTASDRTVSPLPGERPREIKWRKGGLIGSGSFGKVYIGLEQETGELLAVKQISIVADTADNIATEISKLENEVMLMQDLVHPNIVRYLGTQYDDEHLNIFLEYVPGGSIASLLQRFGPFGENLVQVYTYQILEGLHYLHEHNIVHRDIKGGNILVDKTGVVKLADFGASKKIEGLLTATGGIRSLHGTPYWMAPEVIRQSGHGKEADIWSVACTVLEMFTAKHPWGSFNDHISALFHIAQSTEPPTMPEHISDEAVDFLLSCFAREPSARPSAKRLLLHPWISHLAPTPSRSGKKHHRRTRSSSNTAYGDEYVTEYESRGRSMSNASRGRSLSNGEQQAQHSSSLTSRSPAMSSEDGAGEPSESTLPTPSSPGTQTMGTVLTTAGSESNYNPMEEPSLTSEAGNLTFRTETSHVSGVGPRKLPPMLKHINRYRNGAGSSDSMATTTTPQGDTTGFGDSNDDFTDDSVYVSPVSTPVMKRNNHRVQGRESVRSSSSSGASGVSEASSSSSASTVNRTGSALAARTKTPQRTSLDPGGAGVGEAGSGSGSGSFNSANSASQLDISEYLQSKVAKQTQSLMEDEEQQLGAQLAAKLESASKGANTRVVTPPHTPSHDDVPVHSSYIERAHMLRQQEEREKQEERERQQELWELELQRERERQREQMGLR